MYAHLLDNAKWIKTHKLGTISAYEKYYFFHINFEKQ